MATAMDYITDSLSSIGEYAPSEVINSADAAQGLICLNDMLDSWSNESLTSYAVTEQSFPLQPGISVYTIGAGGMINQPRPLRIPYGDGRAYIQDNNANRYPVEVLQRTDWNLIGNLANINSDIPTRMFYDSQYPLGIINVWPVPLIDWTLYFDSYLVFSEFRNLQQPAAFPPGYALAIKRNLDCYLWPYFKPDSMPLPTDRAIRAAQAKAAIKRTNVKPYRALFDRSILRFPRSSYNIYRGQ